MHTNTIANCTALASEFPAAACRKVLRAMSRLRENLEQRYQRSLPHRAQLIRTSIAEAEALAWETAFPHLFLPLLAEEKVMRALEGANAARPGLAGVA